MPGSGEKGTKQKSEAEARGASKDSGEKYDVDDERESEQQGKTCLERRS